MRTVTIGVLWVLIVSSVGVVQGAFAPNELSAKSRVCIDCHKKETPSIIDQWGGSTHYRANVGCFECHQAEDDDVDALLHYEETISIIVSPKDCARCHEKEVKEFESSHHAKAARILGSLDNRLAEVVEGNRGMITPGFPHGNAASAVSGCWQCHGSEIKVLPTGRLDAATWPNTGIGRINPDGSEGSCSACHSRHAFSAAQARNPENCGKCHMGPDHPQLEIYEESKHGVAFHANKDKMNLDNEKWVVGEDYSAAPTCATCHMSATPKQNVTHDVGMRISWNNRPILSVRPEVSDAKLGLPGKNVDWETRRRNMIDVCGNCHNKQWIDNFYTQYDALVELYNSKFAAPGKELMALAKPLMNPVVFANKLDWVWFELWHHEGRRARHGAAMMGPDYTHWHGTYDVAKNFYTEFIPELQELAEHNLHGKDEETVKQAEALQAKLIEILESNDHKWYLGKSDPEELKRREEQRKAFTERYSK